MATNRQVKSTSTQQASKIASNNSIIGNSFVKTKDVQTDQPHAKQVGSERSESPRMQRSNLDQPSMKKTPSQNSQDHQNTEQELSLDGLSIESGQSDVRSPQRNKKAKSKPNKFNNKNVKTKDEGTQGDRDRDTSTDGDYQFLEGDPSKQKKYSLAEFQGTNNYHEDQEEQTPSRTLWIGNINPMLTGQELQQEFGKYGEIESFRILHEKYCAFVNFVELSGAIDARKNLQKANLKGQQIVIHFRKVDHRFPPAYSPQSSSSHLTTSDSSTDYTTVLNPPSTAIWIGNISPELSEDDLWREFSIYGNIENVRLLRQKTCAFVNYSAIEDAIEALNALQGKVVSGLPIRLNYGKALNAPAPKWNQVPFTSNQVPYWGDMHAYTAMLHYGANSFAPMNYPMGLYPVYQVPQPNLCDICRTDYKDTMLQPCNHMCCRKCVLKMSSVPAHTTSDSESSSSPTALHHSVRCAFCSVVVTKLVPVQLSYTPPQHSGAPFLPASVYPPPSSDPTQVYSPENRYQT